MPSRRATKPNPAIERTFTGMRPQIETHELLEAWVHGWTISRRTAPAVKLANGGFRVQVGLAGHVARYILSGDDLPEVRSQAIGIVEPGIWLKVTALPSAVRAVLPAQWSVQTAEYLMGTTLSAEVAANVPPDYHLSIQDEGVAATAALTHASGERAATARVAFSGKFAIFDQVVTEVAHRRKGLGSVVMQALGNHAVTQRSRCGVLVATEEGLALYQALGWYVSAPMAAAVIAEPAEPVDSHLISAARDA